ncbi:hypothetical protein C8R32_11540 [Nitrosospira sp. Nsp5]|uniref:Uncharacterized protein n=1 Tax=Nitrosospira multiformis TaxID=1231 RepID=A0ABY0TC18_9PROT|nr:MULTISPECIES: hypothetical protein [Nitrosospira]PTR05869.1 hypothetical protein C8R32_11540 [Nitrosospira sp. Nsp5]SDQ60292.1 hypothetical protein SAMN05216402_1505 [Nitrosospira multiformis]
MEKSKFELSVELIKALAWPAIVGVLLFSFWAPLQKTANILPSLVDRSETISIAGMSLKVSQKLRAPPEIQAKLQALSPVAIGQLLRNDTMLYNDLEGKRAYTRDYAELLSLGLMDDHADETGKFMGIVELSHSGKQAQTFLLSVIDEFIKELDVIKGPETDIDNSKITR